MMSFYAVSALSTRCNGREGYCKSSIKPPGGGGLIQFQTLQRGAYWRGELISEGGFFKKSNDEDICGSFSVLLPHILPIQHTI